jgi:diketogulonate reductase-like aldo/keto reductase
LNSQRDSKNFPILNQNVTLEDTWRQMEKLVEKGLTRSIGVSNFNIERLERILAIAKIPPAVNQVELHPILPQDKLLQFCKDHNIAVVAYSPLGSGELGLIEHPIVKQVAESEHLTPGQVLISWAVTRGCIVIPKTGSVERLKENHVEGGERKLSQDSMNKLGMISKEKRLNKPRTCDPMDWWGMTCFETQE